MKGCLAILGCLLAAYAAPLFANEVPLILEETIQLPVETRTWDIMPTLSGRNLWVCAWRDSSDFVEVFHSESEVAIQLDHLDNNDELFSVYIYSTTLHGVCIGLGIKYVEWEGGHVAVREYSPFELYSLIFGCDFSGGSCGSGPPGFRVYCMPDMGIALASPPAPAENQSLRWILTEKECWSDVIGGIGVGGCGQYVRLSAPDQGWDCWSERIGGFLTMADYQDEQHQLIAYTTMSSHYSGSNGSTTIGMGFGRLESDSLIPLRWVSGIARGMACTKDNESELGVFFASGNSGSGVYLEGDSTGLLWQVTPSYDIVLCADIAWSDNEEFLGFNPSTRSLDIMEAMVGSLWGQTSPLDSGYAEMKIIGRYHNETRRLVVRYGSELRIYRFGEPIYTDADDARPELPSELTLSAYPNPFNPTTMIAFELPKAARAKLVVYDLTGRQVATLLDEQTSAGPHEFGFDGANLPSGIYFARLSAGELTRTHKLVLMK